MICLIHRPDWKINVEFNPDCFNHGARNDFKQSLKDCKRWALQVLLCSCYNLGHGPWDQGERHEELRTSVSDHFRMLSPAICPLYQDSLSVVFWVYIF